MDACHTVSSAAIRTDTRRHVHLVAELHSYARSFNRPQLPPSYPQALDAIDLEKNPQHCRPNAGTCREEVDGEVQWYRCC